MNQIKKYVLLIESIEKLPKFLYHGTSKKNIEFIKKNGLMVGKSRSSTEGIYLSDAKDVAMNYVLMHSNDIDDGVILKIDTAGIDIDFLKPDDYELMDYIDEPWNDEVDIGDREDIDEFSWYESLLAVNQLIYIKNISPEYISI